MKTILSTLLLAVSTAYASGCAHYPNADLVDEACWTGGQTMVSSRDARDGTHHVVIERTRTTGDSCDEVWREHLVYDVRGTLRSRTLDRVRCDVVEHRWQAELDQVAQTWSVMQAIDDDHDDQHEEVLEYEVAASDIDMEGLGLAASCPVMARLPVEITPGAALVRLGG